MKIDSYSFGRIVIDGRAYTSDVIVCRGEVDPSWWRTSGHELNVEDLTDILRFEPKVVVIGTGHEGCMRVPRKTADFLKEKGIELVVMKTGAAAEYVNAMQEQEHAVFAAHLTC